jgi:uncharacterized protein YkwD
MAMTDQATPRRRLRLAALSLTLTALFALVASPARATLVRSAAAHASSHLRRVEVGSNAWQLFKLTNASRGRFGLPSLQLNRQMSLVARRHSAAMAKAGELFHTTNVDVYLHGIDWHAWGENVGYTPGDLPSIQTAFMHSAPHRENILNHAFRHVAIGTVRVGGTLWVTVFFYG